MNNIKSTELMSVILDLDEQWYEDDIDEEYLKERQVIDIYFLLKEGEYRYINYQNTTFHETALMRAFKLPHIISILLEYGAGESINVQDKFGDTALMSAVDESGEYGEGDPECVALLLGAGADPTIPNYEGRTVFMAAAENAPSSLFIFLDYGYLSYDDIDSLPIDNTLKEELRSYKNTLLNLRLGTVHQELSNYPTLYDVNLTRTIGEYMYKSP